MVKFIADIGVNHNSSLERALELIQEAKLVGCYGVKFQLFDGSIGKPEREFLPLEWLPELRDEAHNLGLQFGCSPFYPKAVEELEPYVDFYKITSNYEVLHFLYGPCEETGKPIICSYRPGYECRYSYTNKAIHKLIAIPKYPTPVNEIHLENIKWNSIDGWSDHTRNPGVLYRVIHHYNAKVVEFHLDLDGKGWEYKHGHCWLPAEIKEVIENVKEGFEAD